MTTLAWHLVQRLGFTWLALALSGGTPTRAEQTGASAGPPAPYQDRVLEDLAPSYSTTERNPTPNLTGWPRMLQLESRWRQDTSLTDEWAQRGQFVYGLLETPNHGILSVDGAIGPGHGVGSLTLRQRDMPLADGWWASHEAGLIYTPSLPLSRKPSRVYLPNALVRGAKGEWVQPTDEISLQASAGQAGWIDGALNNEFRNSGGRRLAAGVQWGAMTPPSASGEAWGGALQAESTSAPSPLALQKLGRNGSTGSETDANSVFLAARRESRQSRQQVNAILTDTNGVSPPARGFWLDAGWGSDRHPQSTGVYWLDPGLTWAGLHMANNVAGAYLRQAWQERQWSAEVSVDWLRSIEHPVRDGQFATGAARWRINRQHQIGAGLSVLRYAGTGQSAFIDWRWRNPWGLGGLRWDQSSGQDRAREQQLTIDQDWAVTRGWSLTSSLSLTRTGGQTSWATAANLAVPLSPFASARVSLNSSAAGATGRHLNTMMSLSWRVSPGWQVEGQYTRYTAQTALRSLDPLAPVPPPLMFANRSLYVLLRFEWQAGSPSTPLGGRPREGGGRIEGTVYMDANRNGHRDADEPGASGVQVYLDNRYVARTDVSGRFEFGLVATGTHTVTLRNESLPLPWGIVGDGQVRVEVGLRDGNTVDIPVQRTE